MSARASERRRVLAGLAVWALLASPVAHAQEPASEIAPGGVIVVSRERVLQDTVAGRALRAAERDLGAAFEARVDAAKSALDAEEAELARIRGQLGRDEFESRAAAFDRRVRRARRLSQKQAAELQRSVRLARDRLAAQLGPVLIEILRQTGASVVLDAGQILVASPMVDATDEAIRLFDERVAAPEIALPDPEPLIEPETDTVPDPAPE